MPTKIEKRIKKETKDEDENSDFYTNEKQEDD